MQFAISRVQFLLAGQLNSVELQSRTTADLSPKHPVPFIFTAKATPYEITTTAWESSFHTPVFSLL